MSVMVTGSIIYFLIGLLGIFGILGARMLGKMSKDDAG